MASNVWSCIGVLFRRDRTSPRNIPASRRVSPSTWYSRLVVVRGGGFMSERLYDRRGFLECMAWVGTAAMWSMSSGVLKGMPVEHAAGRASHDMAGLRFAQISDSHIGFDKPANTDVTATPRAAIEKVKSGHEPPAFV